MKKALNESDPESYNLYRQMTFLEELTPKRKKDYFYGFVSSLILAAIDGADMEVSIPITANDYFIMTDVLHELINDKMIDDNSFLKDDIYDINFIPVEEDYLFQFITVNAVALKESRNPPRMGLN